MNINRVISSSVSFKGYIPVFFYANDPSTDRVIPIIKNENIRKCQSFIARNLNGTARNNKDDGFVSFYKRNDPDYAMNPKIHSVYQQKGPMIYMVTGNDADDVNDMAKQVGIAKADSIEDLGHTKSLRVILAAQNYKQSVESFFKTSCKPVKTKDKSQRLALYLLFDPEYKKRTGELKGFKFRCAKFIGQDSRKEFDKYTPNK